MATCLKVEKGPAGNRSGRASIFQPGSAARNYRVVFDSADASEAEATAASVAGGGSVPAFGAALGNLVCGTKSARQRPEDPREWIVTAEFAPPQPGKEAAPAPEDLDPDKGSRWAIDISIDSNPIDREVQNDVHGKMMLNAVLQPVKGIVKPFDELELTISFTTNLILWAALANCYDADGAGCVNKYDISLIVNGEECFFAAGTLRFRRYSLATTLDVSGLTYWRMKLVLTWRGLATGHRFLAANKGFYRWEGGPVPITDKMGEPVAEAQYLDADGNPLAEGDDVVMLPVATGTGEDGLGFEIIGEADLGSWLLWGLHT